MSLSAWEQQALDSIKEGLARSDPRLVAMLATFTRLVSDEEMPVREKIRTGPWRAVGRRRPRSRSHWHASLTHWRLGFRQPVLLVYLLITVALIVTGLVLSRGGGHSACPSVWAVPCASSTAPGTRTIQSHQGDGHSPSASRKPGP
jgi:hypothetical protein